MGTQTHRQWRKLLGTDTGAGSVPQDATGGGTVICLLASGQLMGLFTTTPETIAAGSKALKIISAGFLVSAISVTTSGAMEGLGKGTQSLVISLFRYVVVIMPTAYLLSHFMGPDGVWNAFWITEVFTAIVSVMVYRKTLKKA